MLTAAVVPTAQSIPSDAEIEARFLAQYPELLSRAGIIARKTHRNDAEDIQAEVVAMAWANYRQAARNNRWLTASQLAWYAAAWVRDGRQIAGTSTTDPFSRRTQQKHGTNVLSITSLDTQASRPRSSREQLSHLEQDYLIALASQEHDGPATLAQVKLDWLAFATTLPIRHRRALYRLSRGEAKGEVARRLGVTPGRVSQLITDIKRWVFVFFDGDVAVTL